MGIGFIGYSEAEVEKLISLIYENGLYYLSKDSEPLLVKSGNGAFSDVPALLVWTNYELASEYLKEYTRKHGPAGLLAIGYYPPSEIEEVLSEWIDEAQFDIITDADYFGRRPAIRFCLRKLRELGMLLLMGGGSHAYDA